jgi:hypothetical protein
MCDTTVGISADFLHTTARPNKFGGPPSEKWDCADKPLDRLRMERRKPLSREGLSGLSGTAPDMLMDVNKRP